MADRIQNRRDTKARWEQYNPILLEGEIGIVTDDPNLYKVGDGVTPWNSLLYRGFNGTMTSKVTGENNTVPSNAAVGQYFRDEIVNLGLMKLDGVSLERKMMHNQIATINHSGFTFLFSLIVTNITQGSFYIFDNRDITIWYYSGRKSLIISINNLGVNVTETVSFVEVNTEYKVYISKNSSNIYQIYVYNAKGELINNKSVTNTTNINTYNLKAVLGDLYISTSISPLYSKNGILKFFKASNSYIEADKALNNEGTWVIDVNLTTVEGNNWNNIGSTQSFFATVSGNPIILIYSAVEDEENKEPYYDNIEKPNLFSPENVQYEKVIDSQYGRISDWPMDSRGEYSVVATFPASTNKIYCIINPYYPFGYGRIGVISTNGADVGNQTADNILLNGEFAVIKAVYNTNPSGAPVDKISFTVCRYDASNPHITDFSLIEIYEMNSVDEALSFINAKYAQTQKLNDYLNLDSNILKSNISTFSQIYQNTSILVFGDSVTAGDGWVNYVRNKLKLKNLYNKAVGGARLRGNDENPHILHQIRNVTLNSAAYATGEYIDGVYVKKIDLVFISAGFNDANGGEDFGSLESVKDVPWEELLVNNGDWFKSVAAAVKYHIFFLRNSVVNSSFVLNGKTIKTRVDTRNAKIIFQTPIQSSADGYGVLNGKTLSQRLVELEKVITEVCEYYSVPVVNGRKCCGICEEEERTKLKYLKDGIHPNAEGCIKLGEMNGSAILANLI